MAVSAIGQAMVGTLRWVSGEERQLSVAVKGCFALRQDAPMVITQSPPLVERDEHADGDPTRTLVRASDFVPYRPQTDLWLTGHAHAPHGGTLTASVARLALFRGGEALFDKSVHVLGDRVSSDARPAPFSMMPLSYERAYGGVGHDDNPVGVGADERHLLPNIVHPDARDRVAGFGPISPYWRARRGALTPAARRLLEQDEPVVPAGFSWAYFQAAPVDQRLPFLHGDEWLVLDGMHPTKLRVRSRLPKARAVARIFALDADPADDAGDAVEMVLDTVAIDADRQTCALTWRGVVSVPLTPALAVAAGIALHGEQVNWERARVRAHAVDEPAQTAAVQDDLDMTNLDATGAASGPGRLDSGDWSTDAWPMYPLAGVDEEVTETKTRADGVGAIVVDDARGLPLPVDTEPGAPPAIDDDDLPWITESAVEPHDSVPPESEPPEKTLVMVEHEQSSGASVPPAPLDDAAYAEALRRAGASEEDIAMLLDSQRLATESDAPRGD